MVYPAWTSRTARASLVAVVAGAWPALVTVSGCGSTDNGSPSHASDAGPISDGAVPLEADAFPPTDAALKLMAPTFSPPSGAAAPVMVAIVAPPGLPTGGVIYYTTDGTVPSTRSAMYTAPIAVTMTETIAAFAHAPGFTDSDTASATYAAAADCGCGPMVLFHPIGQARSIPFLVSLAGDTSGDTICYTLNGPVPTCDHGVCGTGSTTYDPASRVSIDPTVTNPAGQVKVSAVACRASGGTGPVGTETYTLQLAPIYLWSTNTVGFGLPGWDWEGTGAPNTTMQIPADASTPYGPFKAQQVQDRPCMGTSGAAQPTSCSGSMLQSPDYVCWSKTGPATCSCKGPLALTADRNYGQLPPDANVKAGDSLSVIGCQNSPPTNASGYFASSDVTTVMF